MQNLELVNLKCVTYAQPIPWFLMQFYLILDCFYPDLPVFSGFLKFSGF